MSIWINHDESVVSGAESLMKTSLVNDTSDVPVCKRKVKDVLSSKKTRITKLSKRCMFRISGEVEFTKDNKVIVKPDITCTKIMNGKKTLNRGNVICNSCGQCFCSPFMMDTLPDFAMKRNCFEHHKKLEGSKCKGAEFTPLSRMTREEYEKMYKKIREKYNRNLKKEYNRKSNEEKFL